MEQRSHDWRSCCLTPSNRRPHDAGPVHHLTSQESALAPSDWTVPLIFAHFRDLTCSLRGQCSVSPREMLMRR